MRRCIAAVRVECMVHVCAEDAVLVHLKHTVQNTQRMLKWNVQNMCCAHKALSAFILS